ncbi:MAG: Uma2 family endonuclease [Austwickia sp.]|nr:Uma2 family endonuclease [Austwickia sp.]
MTAMTTLPRSRPLTRADLAAMPEDGHRYELIDGVLIVTPGPVTHHQRASRQLLLALSRDVPADLEVFHAPFDVVLADDTVLQPDIVVARQADLTAANLPAAPVLAIEILSPSTRHIDLHLKKSRLEEAGCAAYWVVDPGEPSITAWELRGGRYVEVGHAVGTEVLSVRQPYAVTIRPADLVS